MRLTRSKPIGKSPSTCSNDERSRAFTGYANCPLKQPLIRHLWVCCHLSCASATPTTYIYLIILSASANATIINCTYKKHLSQLIFTCHQLLSAAFSNFRLLTVELAREDRGYRLRVTQASCRLLGQNLLGL